MPWSLLWGPPSSDETFIIPGSHKWGNVVPTACARTAWRPTQSDMGLAMHGHLVHHGGPSSNGKYLFFLPFEPLHHNVGTGTTFLMTSFRLSTLNRLVTSPPINFAQPPLQLPHQHHHPPPNPPQSNANQSELTSNATINQSLNP